LRASVRDALENNVKSIGLVKAGRPPPQRLANRLVRRSTSRQPLLSAVINARNALQRKQTGEGGSELAVVTAGLSSIDKAEAIVLIMVVEKGDKKPTSFAVRTDDALLDALAQVIDRSHFGRRRKTFCDCGQAKE